MSDSSTVRLIEKYLEDATPTPFLTGMFRTPQRNFHNSKKVEFDVQRDEEEIAVPLQDISTGPRQNSATRYENKDFTPPVLDEEGDIAAFDKHERRPGYDPYQDPQVNKQATEEAFTLFRKLENKIRRTTELMCAQVLQNGAITLTDSSSNTIYSVDFNSRSAHKATLVGGTPWTLGGSMDAMGDLNTIGRLIRTNGKANPDTIIFGLDAWTLFESNTNVRSKLDNRRIDGNGIAPQVRGAGAVYQGKLNIGHYVYNLWTYDGHYKDPATGTLTTYIAPKNLIMMSSASRLDLTFGSIPMFGRPEQRAMQYLPPRISSPDKALDMTTNAYFTPDNKHLKIAAGTRPLPLPVAIDTYARLTVAA